MTQGRKSRTVHALASVLMALLATALFSPALAAAQSGAEEEYQLDPNIPNPDDHHGQSLSAGGDNGGGQSGTGGSAAPAAPADPGEPAVTEASGSGGDKGDGKDRRGEGSAQPGANPTKSQQATNQVPAVDTSSSDDGGAPVLLILLAGVAALCTGVAFWRMRRDSTRDKRSRGAGTPGAASESQSI